MPDDHPKVDEDCGFCDGVWFAHGIVVEKLNDVERARSYCSNKLVGSSTINDAFRERKAALQDVANVLFAHAKEHEQGGHRDG